MDGTAQDFERWRARGDLGALTRVFDAQSPGLLRFAVHLVGDASAAEDLVQDTFLTALRRAGDYDAARPLDRWLAGILVRHAHELRREARKFTSSAVPERFDLDTPLEAASRREMSAEIARAVDTLEEPYRAAILLHLRYGLGPADIAHVLNRSPGAVRVQLHRAREMLRKSLPASIASALVALAGSASGLGTARGLETVRNQVLEHAARLAPAASVSGGMLGGAIVMKKSLAAIAVLLALLMAAWWTTMREAAPHRADGSAIAVKLAEPATSPQRSLAQPAASEQPQLRTSAVEKPASGDLQPFRCCVLDGISGEPLVGAKVHFYAPKLSLYSEVQARWPDRLALSSPDRVEPHDWPWFRARPSPAQRLDLERVLSYEGPQDGDEPVAAAITDANGEVEVRLARDRAFVVVEHAEFATRGMPPILDRTVRSVSEDGRTLQHDFHDESLIVRLFREQTLEGQLIDLEGQPLAARMRLRIEGSGPGDRLENGWVIPSAVDSWTIWTDEDGSFSARVAAPSVRIRALDPARFVAAKSVHPVHGAQWSWPRNVDLPTNEIALVPIGVAPTVVVRSAEDGQPVGDYWLQLRRVTDGSPWVGLEHVVSRDGRTKVLEGYAPGGTADALAIEPMAFHVFAEGFLPSFVERTNPRAPGEIVIELQRGSCPRIEGRVLDASRPVVDAAVLLTPADRRYWDCDATFAGCATRTDAEGRFSLLASPGDWVVGVKAGERSRCRFVEHPLQSELTIDLGRDTAVEFVVRVAPGTSFERLHAGISSSTLNRTERLDEMGRARFTSVPAGRYSAWVDGLPGFQSAPGDDEFELVADTTRVVHFESVATAEQVVRLVVDGANSLEGWRARNWTPGPPWVQIEADGRIPLPSRGPGSPLLVEDPRARQYLFRIPSAAPSGDVTLRLSAGSGKYVGRLVGAGATGRRVEVQIPQRGDPLQAVSSAVDADGRFELVALPAEVRRIRILDGRSNENWGGFDSVSFVCARAPSASEFVIELPSAVDSGGAQEEIAVSGKVRISGATKPGAPWTIRAVRNQHDGVLEIETSTRLLSDGAFALTTIPAAEHLAILGYSRTTNAIERAFTIPSGVLELRQDFDLP